MLKKLKKSKRLALENHLSQRRRNGIPSYCLESRQSSKNLYFVWTPWAKIDNSQKRRKHLLSKLFSDSDSIGKSLKRQNSLQIETLW
jgi:hypothetical protein